MSTSTENNSGKNGARRALILALALTLTALLGGYAGGVFYYSGHYFPDTIVGDVLCGNQTPEYVESRNIRNGNDYLLTILDRKGGRHHISGMDFNYEYNAKGEEHDILKQQSAFLWPYEVFQSHAWDLDRSFSYDSLELMKVVNRLEIFSEEYIEAPVNARLDITEDSYQVIAEIPGCTPIASEVLAAITKAIDAQESTVILTDSCYVEPEISSDDASIQNTLTQLDTYTASTIHYEIAGVDENLSSAKIYSFLAIDENGSVSVNERKLDQFVQYLASTYNTYGDRREFTTANGDTITIGGGDYGWVISKAREKAQILEDLAGGTPVSREPMYEQRAVQSGLDDIGSTYLEIDYTNQHMWYFKDGQMIFDSDIVSGNIKRNNGSPDGIFKIVYRQRNATLVGEDYASKVKYFMPFAYNVGFHDADWRNKFGGEIYKSNGSHGCINLPEDTARRIYEEAAVGTPVVAYYREPVILSSDNARISNAYSYVKPEPKPAETPEPDADETASNEDQEAN